MSGTSELLLLLGSLVIFSLVSLNINTMLANNSDLMVSQEYEYQAVAVGQSYIESMRALAFDESTLGGTIPTTVPNDFSNAANFGGNGEGESVADFDDYDDYDEYVVSDTTVHGVFDVYINVIYVTEDNPNVNAGIKTTHKRMDITVSNQVLEHDVTLSYIRSFTGTL